MPNNLQKCKFWLTQKFGITRKTEFAPLNIFGVLQGRPASRTTSSLPLSQLSKKSALVPVAPNI
jgi:hypothetical protein